MIPTLVIVFLVAAGFFILSLLFKILKTPIKLAAKIALHAVLGYAALFVLNFVGSWVGIGLGLNWVNAIIVGVLGVPGVILLLLLQYLL